MRKKLGRIVFDIETEPFSLNFSSATTKYGKTQHAPKMRVACLYDEENDEWLYFEENEVNSLINYLQKAKEVVSFNGKGFDLLVLRKHYGLKGRIPTKGKHIDVHQLMSEKAGFRVSLHKAAKLNLNEGKHTKGREMGSLDISSLKEACKSDVNQTHRLICLYERNKLSYPNKTWKSPNRSEKFDFGTSPGDNMPDICPFCHDVGTIEFVEQDDIFDEMTDGQLSEYLAGNQGYATCSTCDNLFFWDS